MFKDRSLLRLPEMVAGQRVTHLGMLIDPDKQSPDIARARVAQFSQQGGGAILIGGSGSIDDDIFQSTVEAVVGGGVSDIPVIIFPGHIRQIPKSPDKIAGVLNYQYILGSEGYDFDTVYPPEARHYVGQTLEKRGIASVSTLYVLCGDPQATVSRVTGVMPVDTSKPEEQERILRTVETWLQRGVDCVFFDAGSHAPTSANPDMVKAVSGLIDTTSPNTLLFVGGGVYHPHQAKPYKGVVDCISVGTYFEENGVTKMEEFMVNYRTDLFKINISRSEKRVNIFIRVFFQSSSVSKIIRSETNLNGNSGFFIKSKA